MVKGRKRFVSRGGHKLQGALDTFNQAVRGLRCIDIGSSTGGFTDCLLQQGVAQVVGVDVGHGQLHERLGNDLRVVGVEGMNARSMTAESLLEACEEALSERVEQDPDDNDTQPVAPYSWMRNGGVVSEEYDDSDDAKEQDVEAFKAERMALAAARAEGALPTVRRRKEGREQVDITPAFDLITGDLSFISLTLVLPALVPLMKPEGVLLMLVKPQFELQPGQVGKGGIVREESFYGVVEQRLRQACADAGLQTVAWLPSPIEGGDGNREFFIHARAAAASAAA